MHTSLRPFSPSLWLWGARCQRTACKSSRKWRVYTSDVRAATTTTTTKRCKQHVITNWDQKKITTQIRTVLAYFVRIVFVNLVAENGRIGGEAANWLFRVGQLTGSSRRLLLIQLFFQLFPLLFALQNVWVGVHLQLNTPTTKKGEWLENRRSSYHLVDAFARLINHLEAHLPLLFVVQHFVRSINRYINKLYK